MTKEDRGDCRQRVTSGIVTPCAVSVCRRQVSPHINQQLNNSRIFFFSLCINNNLIKTRRSISETLHPFKTETKRFTRETQRTRVLLVPERLLSSILIIFISILLISINRKKLLEIIYVKIDGDYLDLNNFYV